MPGIILKGTQQRSREIPHPLKAFISVGETRNKYYSSGEQVGLCGVMLEKKQNKVTFLKALWSQVSGGSYTLSFSFTPFRYMPFCGIHLHAF